MFNIDWLHIIKLLLPPFKRKAIRIAWLSVLVKPFRVIYDELYIFRDQSNYLANMNGQAIYMQKYLNDLFNGGMSGIIVEPNVVKILTYVGNIGSGYPELYISNSPYAGNFLGDSAYYGNLPDLLIKIPSALGLDAASVDAVVRRYAFAGKNWKQITY